MKFPLFVSSINNVMLYILTLDRPVTIFDLRILRFRKLLSTSIFVRMHVCKLGAKIATFTIKSQWSAFYFYFFPFTLYSYLPSSIPPPLFRQESMKINDSAVIQMGRMVCTQCTVKNHPKIPLRTFFFLLLVMFKRFDIFVTSPVVLIEY